MIDEPKKSGGQPGNQNAAKDDPATSILHMRCRPGDKAAWIRAARRRKLSEWVTESLNRAAERTQPH